MRELTAIRAVSGVDPGGGGDVLGVRTSPFWGTPKLHKEGKNVVYPPLSVIKIRVKAVQKKRPHCGNT